MAELNLIAGKRAKPSTAHTSALNYLAARPRATGAGRLGAAIRTHLSWERHKAECEPLKPELTAVEERLTMPSRRAVKLVAGHA